MEEEREKPHEYTLPVNVQWLLGKILSSLNTTHCNGMSCIFAIHGSW